MALVLSGLAFCISMLCVLIGSCFWPGGPTEYRTRHGIRVFGEKRVIERQYVEMATHAVINESRLADSRYTAQRLSQLKHCSIEFVDGPFPCGYIPTGKCTGVFYPHDCRMIVALDNNDKCGSSSPLVHEQIHAVNSLVDGVVSHGSPTWFYGPQSVLSKANNTLREYCENGSNGNDSEND